MHKLTRFVVISLVFVGLLGGASVARSDYYGSLTLSQSNVTLNVGQSATVAISGGYAPYLMYPIGQTGTTSIFQSVTAGNTLTIIGVNVGSASLNVCSSGVSAGGSGCATLYVTVNLNGYNNNCNYYNNCYNPIIAPITFSQNNPSLSNGQSTTISMYGGGNYSVAYNSNSTAVSTSISGSTLTLTANNVQYFAPIGSTAIVVCSTSTNCAALTVTIGGGTSGGNWSYCAGEGQYCYFSGTQSVQYGANGVYTYRTFTNSVLCSNSVFGDPIFGVVKRCSIGGIQAY